MSTDTTPPSDDDAARLEPPAPKPRRGGKKANTAADAAQAARAHLASSFDHCRSCESRDACAFEAKCDRLTRGGRPTDYSPELAELILTRLAGGEFLTRICRDHDMPDETTVRRWKRTREDFARAYAQAREEGADAHLEQAAEIADDGRNDTYVDPETGAERVDHDVVARSRLRVETRMKLAAMINPRRYGQKVNLEVEDNRASSPEKAVERLNQVLAGIESRLAPQTVRPE